jgi:hypothetical protein
MKIYYIFSNSFIIDRSEEYLFKIYANNTNIIIKIKISMLDKCKIKFENSIGEKILIATIFDLKYKVLF